MIRPPRQGPLAQLSEEVRLEVSGISSPGSRTWLLSLPLPYNTERERLIYMLGVYVGKVSEKI